MGSSLDINTKQHLVASIQNDQADLNISEEEELMVRYPPTLRILNGEIDEVAIFNTALSASKIQQIYDATAVVDGEVKTANLFTGGLDRHHLYIGTEWEIVKL